MTTDIDTIRKWSEGVTLHDQRKHQEAIDKFEQVREPNHKILFNVGCDFLCAGHLKRAVEAFRLCVQKDTNLAIGYFQCGICYHKLQKYRDAALNWNFALEIVKGKKVINYSPLGLTYHLYECEVRHNLALTLLYLGDNSEAYRVLQDAIRLQATTKHKAMFTPAAEACKNGLAFPLLEIPVNAIFRPDRALVDNTKKMDYLGKARVVASLDDNKTTGFSGIQLMAQNGGKIPNISPKTRHKKKGLLSRSLDNILGIDDDDMKKETSKKSENVPEMDSKKGSNVCVGIKRERLEFLRQNFPQNAPPRAPPQRAAPKLKSKTRTEAGSIPTISPPHKIVGQPVVKISKKLGAGDMSGQTVSSSNPEVSRARASSDIPLNEFDVKWKYLPDNQSRGQAWKFTPPKDANVPASRRTSAPTIPEVPKITVSIEIGKRSQSLVPEVNEDGEHVYVNLPLRPKSAGASPEFLDSGEEAEILPYLHLVGGYSGLDQENIEKTSYTNLKSEENLYEEVAIRLKAKLGQSGATVWPSGPSALSVCGCHDNVDFDGPNDYYATPSEDHYEDVDEMALPDNARPFRPIKAKRPSKTTDDLPSRRIQERNAALQIGGRAEEAQPCTTYKTTDDLPKKAPPRPKGPGRPPHPKLSPNPCPIHQTGPSHLERTVSPVPPGGRTPPNRPPPRLSTEAVRHSPPNKPSIPKQFSSVSFGNVRQQQRHVSEGSNTVEKKSSDCAVKVRSTSDLDARGVDGKPQRPSLPEGGFAGSASQQDDLFYSDDEFDSFGEDDIYDGIDEMPTQVDTVIGTHTQSETYQIESRQMSCASATCDQTEKSIHADNVAERPDERTCTDFTEEDGEIRSWRF